MDQKDFLKIYDENKELFLNICRNCTINLHNYEAEDILQESFIRGLKYVKKLENTNIKSYFIKIIQSTAINLYRKQNKALEKHNDMIEINGFYGIDINEGDSVKDINFIYDIINRELKDERSKRMIALFIEGYKYEEIAMIIDIPVGTVKSGIYAIRGVLREKLGDYFDLSTCKKTGGNKNSK